MSFFSFLVSSTNILCFLGIALATVLIEVSIYKKWISPFDGRKLLHIIAITICAYCIYTTTHRIYLSYIFLFFWVVLSILVYYKLLHSSSGNSYGIALFPLAFFILLQCSFLHIHTILFSVLTLAFADAAAGYVGYHYSSTKIIFLQEEKSWKGFIAFYMVTALLYLQYFGFTFPYLALLVPLVPALTELFSTKGSDNITVPILTSFWYYMLQTTNDSILFKNVLFTLLIVVLAIVVVYKKWLTISGATAALWIGIVVLFFKDIIYLLPLAVFLVSGSLASKYNEKKKVGRNALQVFANGIVAIICLLLFYFTQQHIYYIAYFASIAISMADTLSSEVGKYAKQTTFDIITFKKTAVGLSGGISIAGTIAGLLASILYTAIMYIVFELTFTDALFIALIGFVGMLVDSILGSILQAKYNNPEGNVVEEKTSQLVKGFEWCTNDVVNLLSNVVTLFLLFTIKK